MTTLLILVFLAVVGLDHPRILAAAARQGPALCRDLGAFVRPRPGDLLEHHRRVAGHGEGCRCCSAPCRPRP